jgi:DNA-binding MarR family transcriptional regulator
MGSKVSRRANALTNATATSDLRQIMDNLRHIVRALRVSSRGAEKEFGISGAQLFVLQRLAEARALSLGALAERTHTDPSSVSVVVSRLVARGLVRRTASTEDARRAEIRLTPRGRALVLRAPEASQTRLVEALSALEEDTRTALGNGLLSLVASMNLRGAPRMFFEDDPSAQTKKEKANRAHD